MGISWRGPTGWPGVLRARGVGPDVTVAIRLSRSPEAIVAMLAVLRAGGAYVPLDPAYPEKRLAWITADARAAVTLGEDDLVGADEARTAARGFRSPGRPRLRPLHLRLHGPSQGGGGDPRRPARLDRGSAGGVRRARLGLPHRPLPCFRQLRGGALLGPLPGRDVGPPRGGRGGRSDPSGNAHRGARRVALAEHPVTLGAGARRRRPRSPAPGCSCWTGPWSRLLRAYRASSSWAARAWPGDTSTAPTSPPSGSCPPPGPRRPARACTAPATSPAGSPTAASTSSAAPTDR